MRTRKQKLSSSALTQPVHYVIHYGAPELTLTVYMPLRVGNGASDSSYVQNNAEIPQPYHADG